MRSLLALGCLLLASNGHAIRAVMEMTSASNHTIYIDTVNARVGIDTTTPAVALDVAGVAQFGTTKKSTFTTNGTLNIASGSSVTLTGGGLTISNGGGITGSGGGAIAGLSVPASLLTGTLPASVLSSTIAYANGTANRIQKLNGPSNFVNSSITDDGTNVYTAEKLGIGNITSPSQLLDLRGTGSSIYPLFLSGGAAADMAFNFGRTGSDMFFGISGGANNLINGSAAGDICLSNNLANTSKILLSANGSGTASVVIDKTKDVGILTVTPGYGLHVATNIYVEQDAFLSMVGGSVIVGSTLTIRGQDANGYSINTSSSIKLGTGGCVLWGDGTQQCTKTVPGSGDVVAASNNALTGNNTFAGTSVFNATASFTTNLSSNTAPTAGALYKAFIPKAMALFKVTSSSITTFGAVNITSMTRLNNGAYRAIFASPMNSINYSVTFGTARTQLSCTACDVNDADCKNRSVNMFDFTCYNSAGSQSDGNAFYPSMLQVYEMSAVAQ